MHINKRTWDIHANCRAYGPQGFVYLDLEVERYIYE